MLPGLMMPEQQKEFHNKVSQLYWMVITFYLLDIWSLLYFQVVRLMMRTNAAQKC